MIVIDASMGEGGGQVLRTSLALSILTQMPITLDNIRVKRSKPGLMRQHLTCVRAAAALCEAAVTGDEIGSTRLVFEPGTPRAGDYHFAIGTAGSTMLVLHTVLPVLMLADAPSTIILEGGTHNDRAPSVDFMREVFAPQLAKLGPTLTLETQRYGMYPAGGGLVRATIAPRPRASLAALALEERGAQEAIRACVLLSSLPRRIAERELKTLQLELSWGEHDAEILMVDTPGPGNVLFASLVYEHVTEMFTGFGARGKSSEDVARGVAQELKRYLVADAPVGEHLADQLLLPLALAGRGRFICSPPSRHTLTQAELIEKFLEVEFTIAPLEREVGRAWSVEVSA